MLVSSRRPLPQVRNLRSAFTLLEVLVVVAILIVLASVAGIAVFNYLDNAKVDKAKMDMKALDTAYKTFRVDLEKNGDSVDYNNFNTGMLVKYLEAGSAGLTDPWNQPYRHNFITHPETQEMRIQFECTNGKTGEPIIYPMK